MGKRKKLPTERERSYEDIVKLESLYRQMGKLEDGKPVRDYIRSHRAELQRYGIKVSIFYRYPRLPLITSALSLVVALLALFSR